MDRFLFMLVLLPASALAADRPQYIFFNKGPHAAGPYGWHQNRPASFTPESMRDVVETIGTPRNERLRVGVSCIFSILERDVDTLAASLRRVLAASETTGVPILITLDGQNWWQSRGDLWNWWDASQAGYDPANRENVEWTGWGPEHAVKIGWRNWGRQLRVAPAPNLASPRFLAEHWKSYDVLVPIIREWYAKLPAEKRYLFGGVKVGWEASINVNAFYYPNGNKLFEQWPSDESHDPKQRKPEEGWTFGLPPLGYAAVSTAGLRTSGELQKADIERVVHDYLAKLAHEARARGLPPDLIFTHQGGTYAPWDKHLSFKPAINDDSVPGWSFYSHDPAECGSIADDLAAAGREDWCAAEWWRGGATSEDWQARFNATLRFKRCRLVCVYNWESFRKIPEGLAAVRTIVESETAATRPK